MTSASLQSLNGPPSGVALAGPAWPGTAIEPLNTLQVNILIVDDEPKNLAVLESVLDDPGYRLVRAGSGSEALLALMAEEFAVLVLDVRMPEMTGFELAQLIKERRKTARVPIIFLTAYYNEDQHVLEGYVSGAVDYLHKPINAAVLRSKVAMFAELHRKTQALMLANAALTGEVDERRKAELLLSELNATLDRRVTERTQALHASEAKLRDASRRKDEFLATLAHELRNPLAPVRSAVQVLRLQGITSPETKWASEMIDRQVQAMSRLIDDLMDVSRISEGKIELRCETVDMARILRDAVETSRSLIDELGHKLTISLPDDALWIYADPIRMAQVFMNLLNNAAKYMDEGGAIDVGVRVEEQVVEIVIKDTGIGIAPERLENVFAMFSQVETALSRSRGGLGIGLTLTRRLVEMHGGSIVAHSKGLGHGSQFVVRLPLVKPAAAAPEDPVTLAAPPTRPVDACGLRILVADDNQDAAGALTMLLEIMDHSVRQVHDGAAAVEAAAAFDPQLILLDIGMPKLNGYAVCAEIRNSPGGADKTIVAITGWGQPEDRRMSQEAGFDGHLIKPVDPKELDELIEKVFKKLGS